MAGMSIGTVAALSKRAAEKRRTLALRQLQRLAAGLPIPSGAFRKFQFLRPGTSKSLQFPSKSSNFFPRIWTYQGLSGDGAEKNLVGRSSQAACALPRVSRRMRRARAA